MQLKNHFALAILSLFALCSMIHAGNEFSELVFSGFVELSTEASGEENVDFSKIEVILMTEDEKIVDKTMCSSNGFFLLPVYDKKSYIVKVNPPQESTFEPDRIRIDLTNKSPEELKTLSEQSLSFKFVGFSIKNTVSIENSQVGPSNLRVGLYDSKNKQLSEQSSVNGVFRFDKILTGTYHIRLIDNQAGYFWDSAKNSIKCEISWKSGQVCQGSLKVSGLSVRGSFLNYNPSVKNYQIFLYSDSAVKVPCTKPEVKNHPLASKNKAYLCYSGLDEKGVFSFENVPVGSYSLHVNADLDNKIEITPTSHEFKVSSAPVSLDNLFKINKFSLKGRVVDTQGKGIEGVKIILDGDEKGTSDKSGYYYLEKITSGSYSIEGQHDHLFFEVLNNIPLNPTLETIPNLVLSLVHLCGTVSLSDSPSDNEFKNAKVTIYLEKQGEKRSTTPESNGQYCFEVQPGRYNIYPVVTNLGSNVKQDSLLYPRSHDIQVSNEPMLNLHFNRPRLHIKGSLVPLPDTKAEQLGKTKITISSKTKSWTDKAFVKDNHFEFRNVLPGVYEITIENNNLCWEEEKKTVELVSANLTSINFKQSGFALRYKASRPVMVQITGPGITENYVTKLDTNVDRYCVKRAGNYELTPDNCFQFSTQNFTASTDDENGIFIDPTAYYVKGQVLVNTAIGKNLKNTTLQKFIEKNIILSTTITEGGATENKLLLLENEGTENGFAKFSYSAYVKPNSKVVIEPRPKQKVQGPNEQLLQNLIFNPKQLELNIRDNCIIDQPENRLEIRQGFIYYGSVSPAVSDWKLLVHYEDSGKLVQSVDIKGTEFRVGPFVDLDKYKISAEKSGYKFDATIVEDGYNVYNVSFNAQKLSHLELRIVDENSKPISGALIFISSTAKKNFLKINNYTDEKGYFRTQHLVKGEYLIKAVLKEYSFEPGQTTISIEDGEHKNMEIRGRRVAFSLFGNILNLNKQGCEDLTVEANPIDSSATSESAKTDAQGAYRIRGLVPDTKYRISVQPSSRYVSIKPSEIVVKAEAKDIQAIQFIGFERKTTHTIGGSIKYDSSYSAQDIDQIEAVIVKLVRGDETVETITTKSFRYYEFRGFARGNYRLVAQIKRLGNAIPTEIVQNIDENSFDKLNFIEGDIVISKDGAKKSETVNKNSFFGPILMLAVILLILNLESVLIWYKKRNNK